MTILLIALVIAATAFMVYGILLLLSGDGYGASADHRPPGSHYPDPFDPRYRGRLV
jgi:hypothetical protein